ncbi:carbohydrate ABC transporter membrane protein 2 (CUT1 family) [Hydrogenispora ethanolica]|uniref:Carbohydrate ABC transporter membrane protein 2 (CUT1 family) n=1 Tax=Hydrogenispora ethanolica TaxID=1082276 RepID=A0A4R1QLY2_HYDET|nr:carbohydrate ABC transporter permease [Hydrogenispora ethanolica]TCL54227.1 carbohydrate ABC transporter membrane protein 2 (CUT1 family) [Hydrogenispora ethanolica]
MNTRNSEKIFDRIVLSIILFTVILCILPFFHVAAISLSSNSAIIKGKVWLFPVEVSLQTYLDIFRDQYMTGSLFFTVQLTILYTIISMFMTTIAAFPLTQKRLLGRKIFLFLIIFTMFFSGGIIPDYLLVKNLHLTNTIWALILPGMISCFNLIILKTFFNSIPESLLESARLDGCSDLGVLFKIVLPLSTPVLATLGLFYAVSKWNSFQDALFYITEPKLYPIQLKLYQIVQNSLAVDMAVKEGSGTTTNQLPESLKSACVMFATIPIVLVYPWLQRYFVKGVMIGAIKG